MRRGEVYQVEQRTVAGGKKLRAFVVLSRQLTLDSPLSTVICAPVLSAYDGLASQVPVGIADGLPYDGSIHCDALLSLPKMALKQVICVLPAAKLKVVDKALAVALDLG